MLPGGRVPGSYERGIPDTIPMAKDTAKNFGQNPLQLVMIGARLGLGSMDSSP